jgi:hypothetical protein
MEMRRLLACGAAAWVVGFTVLYLLAVNASGNDPAWWFLGVLLVVVVGLGLFAAGRVGRPALLGSGVVLGAAVIVSLASIGIILAPALAAVTVALTRFGDRHIGDPDDPDGASPVDPRSTGPV